MNKNWGLGIVKIAIKEPKYNRESLIAESIELLIAGTDTTAHTLSFAVAELSLNPKVFAQARSVVEQVWQKQGAINIESFKELGYVRAIIKETLRLYSVSQSIEVHLETSPLTPLLIKATVYTQVPSVYVSGILDPLNRHCERSEAIPRCCDCVVVPPFPKREHSVNAMTGFQRF